MSDPSLCVNDRRVALFDVEVAASIAVSVGCGEPFDCLRFGIGIANVDGT
jgi:hypothetical protein